MGCYAAFPALKMARSFCESNPDAAVSDLSVALSEVNLVDYDFQAAFGADSVSVTS